MNRRYFFQNEKTGIKHLLQTVFLFAGYISSRKASLTGFYG